VALTAWCAPGQVVTGGGLETEAPGGGFAHLDSHPVTDGVLQGWRAEVRPVGIGQSGDVIVTAICAE
jgi:hypothetical protein